MIDEIFARLNSGALLRTMQKSVDRWRPVRYRATPDFSGCPRGPAAQGRPSCPSPRPSPLVHNHGAVLRWFSVVSEALIGPKDVRCRAAQHYPVLVKLQERVDPLLIHPGSSDDCWRGPALMLIVNRA